MDEQKDIQTPNVLSRFFDKHSIRTNPFGANRSADRAYRRTERIVAALYLVTNHIPTSEPLRVAVREGALRLAKNMLLLRDEMRSIDSECIVASRASIRHLISLTRMLAVSGLLSMQNTDIVVHGLDELGNFLVSSQNSILSESTPLTEESLLDVGGEASVKDIKDTRVLRDGRAPKDKPLLSDKVIVRDTSNVREQYILATLRGKGELGIRDIASNLPEYGEKMVQRELAALVAGGRVKKTGLKRWSRYSIVS
ncbi:hypothetical protein A2763_00295 [Candidatus Kaiserbacteria bacterium RIFCSPHIGHO2_01_FULL_54_36]|uniref:HTH deoR-type domain-containing protein n=1 Tax=Candidatus Kaiserbacteria bacterium RIFCSPHIGHO2_01_FULL_54_36 TaxID=1798482 RepID=A0A1F6CL17_9BACT|nr:MAG: hypothetical protein A2763_00295 [Candidatus Kaiserbacteria bacterium RIFCSPHIGHO2_01_FULL_54_36]OGG75677.1 MAG: hypothetical protein A3A41_04710 [Candidatus Kaiserbacteria bacterium RIFCSPLOWO2_01_FULL_54_22]